MRTRDPDTEAWIERARRADLWQVLDRISGNHAVKRRGRRGVGPCPACGGKDRFSIDTGKGMFFCRGTARTGGDVIALVQHITGASFFGACEEITGEAMPRRAPGDDVRRADPHLMEQRKRDAEENRWFNSGTFTQAPQQNSNPRGDNGGFKVPAIPARKKVDMGEGKMGPPPKR